MKKIDLNPEIDNFPLQTIMQTVNLCQFMTLPGPVVQVYGPTDVFSLFRQCHEFLVAVKIIQNWLDLHGLIWFICVGFTTFVKKLFR